MFMAYLFIGALISAIVYLKAPVILRPIFGLLVCGTLFFVDPLLMICTGIMFLLAGQAVLVMTSFGFNFLQFFGDDDDEED